MRTLFTLILTFYGFATLTFAAQSNEEDEYKPIRLTPDMPADVSLEGTSNVRDWTCLGKDVDAIFETSLNTRDFYILVQDFIQGREPPDGELAEETASSDRMLRVYVEIAPGSLDCGNARMERDLRRAVRADEFPVISYWFTGIQGEIERIEGGDRPGFEVDVTGILIITDQPQEVTHTAHIRIIDIDKFEVSGAVPLKMTDFDIEPPRALFGIVRADDAFDVTYRFIIRPQPDAEAVPPYEHDLKANNVNGAFSRIVSRFKKAVVHRNTLLPANHWHGLGIRLYPVNAIR